MESEATEFVTLDMTCPECGYELVLDEGMDHMIHCVHCPLEPAEGATPADAVTAWLDKHPAPTFLPTTIHDFIVPKHDGLRIEVAGMPFPSLAEAEKFVSENSGWLEIHCYSATTPKA